MRNTEQTILFGKYRVLGILGEGASSQVYLIEHMRLQTYRAMKRISKAHPLLSQFRLEANLLKSLHHPSIPIIYDMEEDEQFLFIIEEYVQGESLQKYLLYHDTISQEYMMRLGIRLCEVFAYLHSRTPYPVCYKDLKPEHIIVYGNSVKIIDFGIASYMTGQERKVRLGTTGYAAPEQYTEETVTPAADIYALGMVLQQMEKRAKNSSGNLHRIIQKATERDIGRRYGSALELKQALEEEMKRICPKKNGNTHLYNHIAVAGAGRGTGVTHIAFAITAYFNRMGYPCLYRSKNETDTVERLIRGKHVKEEQKGVYQNGFFQGILREKEAPEGYACVMDFGNQLDGCIAEEADLTLLIVGGSVWQEEEAFAAFQKTECVGELAVLCNRGTRGSCLKYADYSGRRVYGFPEDRNPLAITPEKKRLFEKLLQMKKRSPAHRGDRRERRSVIFSETWRE